ISGLGILLSENQGRLPRESAMNLFFRVAPGWAPHGSDRPREASRSVAGNDTTTRFPALPDFTTL
ncbi:hypothetical protein KDE37_28850, partial [Pseudomonas aeruginosa]|uniref:hypothetical protein n=1 Tax=Pseudomonas aeruginosa TaxID=287 RepID=UPI001B842CED